MPLDEAYARGVKGVVKLHVESPVPTSVLEHRDWEGQDAPSTPLCRAPCDRVVDGRGRTFVFKGASYESSLSLDDRSREVRVDVHPGSRSLEILGAVLAIGGILTTSLGAAGLICSIKNICRAGDSAQDNFFARSEVQAVHLGLLISGPALLVPGFVLVIGQKPSLSVTSQQALSPSSRVSRY